MPLYKKIPTEIEAVEFVGEEIPGFAMTFDQDDEGAMSYAVYNHLHDSWIKLKVGDFVRIDLAPKDVYPIDRAYFLENFVPAGNGSTGTVRIAAERNRQIEVEGWSAEHDSQHNDESLAMAAIHYAAPEPPELKEIVVLEKGPNGRGFLSPVWPDSWDKHWNKKDKHGRLRQLEIAGALIAAEIDRLST